ncbi:MAG: malonyl-ACP O-methyltransferase BioC [Fusobacterium sp.]|nr:malonyl-ACP O-methyltransferase BioC [Fusobacterium sp.]
MQVNPKLLKQKFEKSMPKYNENAFVQREMAEQLVRLLIQTSDKNFSHILELGSGTGLLTELIVKELQFERLTCNDLVEKSKVYLDKIVADYDFIAGNSCKIKPAGAVNLILSNAMFQWFSSLTAPLEHYCRILEKNGILAFSTFSKDNFKEIRDALGVSLNYFSVDEIRSVLEKDFEILDIVEFERVLNFNTPLELLAHLKNTGVNSLNSKKMTFHDIKEFCDNNSASTLTYAPVIVIAKKK